MDDELFVDLHTLSATRISVCRLAVLQQGLDALGISMHRTNTYDDDSDEVLCSVHIEVPPHIYMPRLETKLFHGEWSLTSDAAVESACFSALVYLQKVNMLIIDGIHSDELKRCQRKLLEASFWAEAFQEHTGKAKAQLTSINNKRRQGQTAGLPSFPLPEGSSSNTMSIVTDLSAGIDYATKKHGDPLNHLAFVSTPPSVTKPIPLRARNGLLESKVCRPLFQSREDKEKTPEIGNKMEENTTTDLKSLVNPTLLESEGKP